MAAGNHPFPSNSGPPPPRFSKRFSRPGAALTCDGFQWSIGFRFLNYVRNFERHLVPSEVSEMNQPVSRRSVLRAGAAGAAALAGAAAGIGWSAGTASALPDNGVSAFPFPLTAVRLLPGPFLSNAGRTQSYLDFLDPDRMLHTFRLNVGLPSSAAAMGGWESPTTELRGHSMGHLLSALAQAYAT